VKEVNEGIYLWHHADEPEPLWEVPRFPELNDTWAVHGRTEHVVSAHIQEMPENGVDTAHLNVLHTSFAIDFLFSFIFTHVWSATWTAGTEEKEHTAEVVVKQGLKFLGWLIPGSTTVTTIQQIGPGLVFLFFETGVGRFAVHETVTPLAPLLQRVTHTAWAEPRLPRVIAKIVFRAMLGQFERDVPIWNTKTYVEKPILVKNDGNIGQYRRWFAKFYSQSSRTWQSNPLEW